MNLLTKASSNAKLLKSDNANRGFLSSILHLAPYRISGKNVCPHASKGCAAACLNTAGFGAYDNVQAARIRRTRLFFEDRETFTSLLRSDINSFAKRCKRKGSTPAVRLNGTSDLAWEKLIPSLFSDYPDIQFYDYTKSVKRMLDFCNGNMPSNYHLTFSRSENNHNNAMEILENGGNVAVVFAQSLPSRFCGFPVHSGDETDLRFLDPHGVVGLTAKGKGKKDSSGFVVPTYQRHGKTYANYRKLK